MKHDELQNKYSLPAADAAATRTQTKVRRRKVAKQETSKPLNADDLAKAAEDLRKHFGNGET